MASAPAPRRVSAESVFCCASVSSRYSDDPRLSFLPPFLLPLQYVLGGAGHEVHARGTSQSIKSWYNMTGHSP